MAARHNVVEHGSANGLLGIATQDGLQAMHALVARRAGAHIMVAPVNWSRYLANDIPAGQRSMLSGLRESSDRSATQTKAPARQESWLPKLHAVAPSHWKDLIAALIEERIQLTLQLDRGQSVPPDQPLQELGLDSLLSIELRNALGLALDRTLPATLLFNYPTLNALTEYVVRELGGETPSHQAARIAPKPSHKSLLDDIEALSDDEVERLLGEKSVRGAV
jgi:acyl carrier protein